MGCSNSLPALHRVSVTAPIAPPPVKPGPPEQPALPLAVPQTVATTVVFAPPDGTASNTSVAFEALVGGASTPAAAQSSLNPTEPRAGRNRGRRTTKENMLTKRNLKSGQDEFGLRVRIFTASLCCERAHGLGLDKFTWEGDTVDSDKPGLRMPGKARHGEGTITYESGDSYTGGWKHDKRSGFGKMTFACGDVYEGEWVEGKYEGHGKYTNVEIGTYEGEWKANKKQGTGRTCYATGDVFEGSYVEGVREGYGTYTKGNGEIRMGRYEKGELVADN